MCREQTAESCVIEVNNHRRCLSTTSRNRISPVAPGLADLARLALCSNSNTFLRATRWLVLHCTIVVRYASVAMCEHSREIIAQHSSISGCLRTGMLEMSLTSTIAASSDLTSLREISMRADAACAANQNAPDVIDRL